MEKKKMDNATRHRRLAWIGGGSLVVLVVVTAICAPELLKGQASLGALVRNLISIVLVVFAISVINKKRRDKDLGD